MTTWNKISLTLTFTSFLLAAGCMDASVNKVSAGTGLTDEQMFTLKDTQGNTVSLEETLKGKKAVLINFWATWCPPCREEIPGLIALQSKLGGDEFTILGIDAGESKTRVSSFMEKTGINYPVLLDSDSTVATLYHVVGIPTSLLINSSGKIIGEYHAYTPKLMSDVEKAIQ
jgi:peroxiredoxin